MEDEKRECSFGDVASFQKLTTYTSNFHPGAWCTAAVEIVTAVAVAAVVAAVVVALAVAVPAVEQGPGPRQRDHTCISRA